MLGLLLSVGLFVASFGQAVVCTNEYSCTEEHCPAACDWPMRSGIGLLVILPASGALAIAEAMGLSAKRPAMATASRVVLALVAASFAGLAFLWRL